MQSAPAGRRSGLEFESAEVEIAARVQMGSVGRAVGSPIVESTMDYRTADVPEKWSCAVTKPRRWWLDER